MKLRVKRSRWSQDQDGVWVCFLADNPQAARQMCAALDPEKKWEIDLRNETKKRSLDANAYFWVLCGKLASVLRITTTEVYRWCVREIGDNFTVVPIREDAFAEWERIWGGHGDGWIVEDLGECRSIPGYHYAKSYYGSSMYNTVQMSRLIDLVVEACKEQGIDTATPEEISLMKARWADAEQTHKGSDDT